MEDIKLEKKLKGLHKPKLPDMFSKSVMRYIYENKIIAKNGIVLTFQRVMNYLCLGIFGILCVFGFVQFLSGIFGSNISEYFSLLFNNFDIAVSHLSLVLSAMLKSFPLMSFLKFAFYTASFFASIKLNKILHSNKYLKSYG
jgi:hypothetical protein